MTCNLFSSNTLFLQTYLAILYDTLLLWFLQIKHTILWSPNPPPPFLKKIFKCFPGLCRTWRHSDEMVEQKIRLRSQLQAQLAAISHTVTLSPWVITAVSVTRLLHSAQGHWTLMSLTAPKTLVLLLFSAFSSSQLADPSLTYHEAIDFRKFKIFL